MTDFFREPVREWLERLEGLVDSAGGVTLDPLSFFARGAGGSQGAISPAIAHQTILGHGTEWTLSMFGWTSGDIHTAAQAAINAAVAAGGGTVVLPSGALTCSASLVVIPTGGLGGVLLRGSGRQGTQITFPHGFTGIGIDFQGGGINGHGSEIIGGGVHGVMVFGAADASNTGAGVAVRGGCLLMSLKDVWTRGFDGSGGTGLSVTDAGAGINSENIYFSDCHFQSCETGARLQGANPMTFIHCMFNQNTNTGLYITDCGASFIGSCMWQGISPRMIRIDSVVGGSDITVDGMSYSEYGPTSSFGFLTMTAGATNRSSLAISAMSAAGGSVSLPLLDITGCHLSLNGGRLHADGWSKHIKARNMLSVTVTNPHPTAPLYDLDAASASVATWAGSGILNVGTAAPAPGLVANLCASDGSKWDARNNFIQLLSGILGYKLRACWHAGFGVGIDYATGAFSTWTDQVGNRVLTNQGGGTQALYQADGSNFLGHPVLYTVVGGTAGKGMRGTGLTPVVLAGEVPWICEVGRYAVDNNSGNLFNVGAAPNYDYRITILHPGIQWGQFRHALVAGPTTVDLVQHTYRLQSDGTSSSDLWVDGTNYNLAAGAGSVGDITEVSVGYGDGSVGLSSSSFHGCLIICSEAPTAAEWAAASALLQRDFG